MKITSVSKSGLDFIKAREGLSLTVYKCSAGVPTIGYGSTRYEDGRRVNMEDKEISLARSEMLLANTLKTYESSVDAFTRDDINQFQFDALVSFAYNLGVQALKDSTLLKKVNANPNDKAIAKEFEKWIHAGGKKLPGLLKRRKQEAEMYFS